MVQIQLSHEHAEVLVSVLESALSDLSYEISNTDSQDYRDMLKRRREALDEAVGSLRGGLATEEPLA